MDLHKNKLRSRKVLIILGQHAKIYGSPVIIKGFGLGGKKKFHFRSFSAICMIYIYYIYIYTAKSVRSSVRADNCKKKKKNGPWFSNLHNFFNTQSISTILVPLKRTKEGLSKTAKKKNSIWLNIKKVRSILSLDLIFQNFSKIGVYVQKLTALQSLITKLTGGCNFFIYFLVDFTTNRPNEQAYSLDIDTFIYIYTYIFKLYLNIYISEISQVVLNSFKSPDICSKKSWTMVFKLA